MSSIMQWLVVLANAKVRRLQMQLLLTQVFTIMVRFTATTRQNDLDTSVTISFQPGAW